MASMAQAAAGVDRDRGPSAIFPASIFELPGKPGKQAVIHSYSATPFLFVNPPIVRIIRTLNINFAPMAQDTQTPSQNDYVLIPKTDWEALRS